MGRGKTALAWDQGFLFVKGNRLFPEIEPDSASAVINWNDPLAIGRQSNIFFEARFRWMQQDGFPVSPAHPNFAGGAT